MKTFFINSDDISDVYINFFGVENSLRNYAEDIFVSNGQRTVFFLNLRSDSAEYYERRKQGTKYC